MCPPRCRIRSLGIIAATALIALAIGSANTAARYTPTTGTWTDPAAGNAEVLVTNRQSHSPIVPYGSASYGWSGLAPGTSMCFAVAARNMAGYSGWSPWACATTRATTPWSETDARNDLLKHLAATPLAVRNGLHDAAGNTMDTAKVIQASPGNYLAVYATGNVIKLATSTELLDRAYVTHLHTSATQPYIARTPNRSYIVTATNCTH